MARMIGCYAAATAFLLTMGVKVIEWLLAKGENICRYISERR
ncbi:Uncharacterised protein [Mycobacteroides abscessus subsp. abscessus]|nr:Uncharacterised protein [Mycobacteroides abscessus subsp. abscessus]